MGGGEKETKQKTEQTMKTGGQDDPPGKKKVWGLDERGKEEDWWGKTTEWRAGGGKESGVFLEKRYLESGRGEGRQQRMKEKKEKKSKTKRPRTSKAIFRVVVGRLGVLGEGKRERPN